MKSSSHYTRALDSTVYPMRNWKDRRVNTGMSVTRWVLVLLLDISLCLTLGYMMSFVISSWLASTIAFLVAFIPTSKLIDGEVI